MFFVLSGFGMQIGYGSKSYNLTFIPYIQKRLKRLYPEYAISMILGGCYMIYVLGYDYVITILKFPIYVVASQTLTPFVSSTGFNSPAWYVATLIWIYVGYFFFSKIKTRYKWLAFAIYAIYLNLIWNTVSNQGLTTWLYYHSPYARCIDFLIGAIGGILYQRFPIKCKSITIMTLLEIIFMTGFTIFVLYDIGLRYISLAGIFLSLTFYVFSHQKGWISQLFSIRTFGKLAKYSYSFYLIHYLVIMTITKVLELQPGVTTKNIAWITVMFITTVVLAYMIQKTSTKIIEISKKITAS